MAQSKLDFFHRGVLNQKQPDIVINLTRKDVELIKKWTPEEKVELRNFMERAEESFNAFKNEILNCF